MPLLGPAERGYLIPWVGAAGAMAGGLWERGRGRGGDVREGTDMTLKRRAVEISLIFLFSYLISFLFSRN